MVRGCPSTSVIIDQQVAGGHSGLWPPAIRLSLSLSRPRPAEPHSGDYGRGRTPRPVGRQEPPTKGCSPPSQPTSHFAPRRVLAQRGAARGTLSPPASARRGKPEIARAQLELAQSEQHCKEGAARPQ